MQFAISVELVNVTFHSNMGASLILGNGEFIIKNVIFINNTGSHTGGIVFAESFYGMNTTFDDLFFKDNKFTEIYGGVIYIQTSPCNLFLKQHNLYFNDATQLIFFSFLGCIDRQFKNLPAEHLRTVPYRIETKNPILSLFPGQPILIRSLNITDYYGHESHCTAIPNLECHTSGNNSSSCHNNLTEVMLNGKKLMFIQSSDQIETSLYLTSKSECSDQSLILKLKINCVTANTSMNVTLRTCPLGYVFNASSGMCQRAVVDNDNNIVYDELIGIVCIKHNYWYGGNGD